MPQLVWDQVGSRTFEAGVDRGVLFTTDGTGIAWSGLTSVKENSVGADIAQFFIDGVKYLETIGVEDFQGTIEALTYPTEFEVHDGTRVLDTGLIVRQQRRKPFAFSYRTRIGSDANQDLGYKIHIVYNALAQPTDREYATLSDSLEPMKFTWQFTTTPKKPKSAVNYAPVAHVVIDSTKTNKVVLRYLESRLYGSNTDPSTLISLDDLFKLFESPLSGLSIFAQPDTGLSRLVIETLNPGDLIGDTDEGLYDTLPESRLTPTGVPGYYKIGTRP